MPCMLQTMDLAARTTLQRLMANVQRGHVPGPTIVICHSGPLAWAAPQPAFDTPPCPPSGVDRASAFVVGRTMFETDQLPAEYLRRCNAMDEIWVPSQWSKASMRMLCCQYMCLSWQRFSHCCTPVE
jgi:hypothetical protein